MTNQERKERRREAALKAARTRAVKQAAAAASAPAEPEPEPEPRDTAPTGRQLIERAQAIGRESDLWYL